MNAWYAIVIVGSVATSPVVAENLKADAARRFVMGKFFEFSCFDGSRGAGRIYGDGSVIGTIQIHGTGPVQSVSLPSGTLRIKGEAICASLEHMPIQPCFDVNKVDYHRFRGSVSGLNFAYCDFTRRTSVVARSRALLSQPLSLDPAAAVR